MAVSESEIAEIANALHLKSPAVFSRLYTVYAPALLGSIQRVIPCASTAEDILQNVMIKIWKGSDQYNAKKGRLFTWMITIARNEALDHLRNQHNQLGCRQPNPLDSRKADPFSTDRLINRMDMRKMIGRLPSHERSIIELYIAGFTCCEISNLLQLPEGTVKSRMRTSYRKLRLALQE